MAVDYLFVSQALVFVSCFTLMIMAFMTESIYKIILHFLSGIGFFFLAQLLLMAYSATAEYTIPMHYYFYLFAIVNLFLFMVYGIMGMAAIRRRRQEPQESDDMI